MRLADHERIAKTRLMKAGVDSPGLCARILTAYAADVGKIEYILSANRELSEEKARLLDCLLARREKGEPLAYLLGKKEFFTGDFFVSPGTLIPRPETELLVETSLEVFDESKVYFVDLGCGSGCIGLSLLCARPTWEGILLDNSSAALEAAKINALKMAPRAKIVRGDIFSPPVASESCHLVISNPPYIGQDEEIMPEVLAWEPHSALFSHNSGYGHIQAVITAAKRILKLGGYLIIEHGYLQGPRTQKMLQQAGFEQVRDLPDLAGLPRCACGRKVLAENVD